MPLQTQFPVGLFKRIVPISIDFTTLGNGALPPLLAGSTWSIASGKAINTPGLGSELITNGSFEVDASGWTGVGSPNTLERNTTTPIAGTGDLHIGDSDNVNSTAYTSALVTAGRLYRAGFTARKIGTRLASAGIGDNALTNMTTTNLDISANLTTSNVNYLYTRRANATGTVYPKVNLNNEASQRDIYSDDWTLKEITIADIFAAVNGNLSNISVIRAAWNITASTQAGVFGWWDGVTPLQNCIVAYHTGTRCLLEKYVGTTKTILVDLGVTYVAGREVEIRHNVTTNVFQLWYNGAQVGADQTISDVEIINNRRFGLYSLAVENQCLSVKIEGVEPLPVWGVDMTRNAGNPLISTTDTATGGLVAADPFLIVIGNKLYIFFESTLGSGTGEEWMAESTDGVTWTNFQKVSTLSTHYAHPTVLIDSDTVHLYMQNQGGLIQHRSSPITGFPNWSAETTVFDSTAFGWVSTNEVAIIKHTDNKYYLLGVQSNDLTMRGIVADTLPTNWNTEGTEMSVDPLIDEADFAWLSKIVEVTHVISGSRLLLYFGVTLASQVKRAIGVFEVTSLTPTGMSGFWRANGFTFGLASSGWDSTDLHRMSCAYFDGQWVCAYDGVPATNEWKIGFATR